MARNTDALNGFLDPGCTIRGDLEFENVFRLDGRVEGTVRSSAELLIGEKGVVEGEVHVARCVVGGQVRGVINATSTVQLLATARVWGDVKTPSLVMEDGAFLEGKVAMEGGGAPSGGTPRAKGKKP